MCGHTSGRKRPILSGSRAGGNECHESTGLDPFFPSLPATASVINWELAQIDAAGTHGDPERVMGIADDEGLARKRACSRGNVMMGRCHGA